MILLFRNWISDRRTWVQVLDDAMFYNSFPFPCFLDQVRRNGSCYWRDEGSASICIQWLESLIQHTRHLNVRSLLSDVRLTQPEEKYRIPSPSVRVYTFFFVHLFYIRLILFSFMSGSFFIYRPIHIGYVVPGFTEPATNLCIPIYKSPQHTKQHQKLYWLKKKI